MTIQDKIITKAMLEAGVNEVPIHYAGFKPDAEELALSIYTAMRSAARLEQERFEAAADQIAITRSTAQERERCDFCDYPLPEHSDSCIAWHSQRGLEPPTGSIEERARDDDAEWLRKYAKQLREFFGEAILGVETTPNLLSRLERIADRLQAKAPETASLLLYQLRTLAVALHDKHYPEVTQWEPLDDACGLLSQIDNMTTGLVRAPETGEGS